MREPLSAVVSSYAFLFASLQASMFTIAFLYVQVRVLRASVASRSIHSIQRVYDKNALSHLLDEDNARVALVRQRKANQTRGTLNSSL
jgi:hypothetical protein